MNGDATFVALLDQTAQIARPVVELSGDGVPKTPTYEATGECVPMRVTPGSGDSEDDLLGRVADATHVIYTTPADIRVADLLVTRPVTTALSDDVQAGDTALPVEDTDGIVDGQRVEIGQEELEVQTVGADAVTVTTGLEQGYEEEEPLSVIVRYEVLGVEDEAGAGHHLRIAAAKVG